MATIHLKQRTSSTPEHFVAGLTDFGPGRSELFGRSADQYLEVHDQGSDRADVTEGSGILENTVKAIEARNGAADAAHPTPA